MALFGPFTLKGGEKIELVGNLATMLGAGIPILEAVESLAQDTKGNQLKVLSTLKADLSQGKQIHDSFGRFPGVFDKVTVNLIKAAEEAGTLETTLKDLKDNMEKEAEFVDKIRLALVYPGLICVVFFGVILVILIMVVPRIATVFSRLNMKLPLPTRIMIMASDLLTKKTALVFGVGGIIFVLLLWLWRTKKSLILRSLFGLPVIKGLVKNIDLARFSRTMYLLLSSGIPIDEAVELSSHVVLRQQTIHLLQKAKEMVMSGKRLTDGLRASPNVMPRIVIKLVEAGEKSGTLEKSMADISHHLDYQVSNSLKSLTSVLEPVLLVLVGLSVGGMMMAIIAPIYGLIGSVNIR